MTDSFDSDAEILSLNIRTPTGFEAAVKSMSPLQFAEAVAPLTEAERKKLSKTAQELFRDYRESQIEKQREMFGGRTIRLLMGLESGSLERAAQMHFLALLAVAAKTATVRDMTLNVGQVRSPVPAARNPAGPECERAAVRILCDRRPDWANDWLNTQLGSNRWTGSLGWNSVRALIKSETCQRPASEAYVRVFASAAINEDFTQSPDLLDDIWLLFQFETGVFGNPTLDVAPMHPSYKGPPIERWPRRISQLLQSGYLDRQRLQSEFLASLWKDWKPTVLAGIAKFHDLIEFTDYERIDRFTDYVAHLANPVPTIVAWAIRNLKLLSSHQDFDATAVIDAMPPVFNASAKAQPIAALSLLALLTKTNSTLIPLACSIVERSLTHENIDVQEAGLKLVESWQKGLDKPLKPAKKKSKAKDSDQGNTLNIEPQSIAGKIADVLSSVRGQLSPVLMNRMDSLLQSLMPQRQTDASDTGETQMQTPEHLRDSKPSASNSPDTSEIQHDQQQRINALPDVLRDSLRLQESLDAALDGRLLPAINIDDLPSVLPYVEPVVPVECVEELIDAIAAVLEHVSSPMEIERILDGIGRFGMNYPSGFDERVAAVVHRLHTPDQNFNSDSLRIRITQLPMLASLISIWLSQDTRREIEWARTMLRHSGRSIKDQLLNHRTDEIRRRLMNKELTGPLLSLPTHENGWIDPLEFVRRLQTQQQSASALCRIDLTTALLRLAPDHRAEALAQTETLSDRIRDIVRYALDAEPQFTDSNRDFEPEWLAAGRSRFPNANLTELNELQLPVGPNVVQAAGVNLQLEHVRMSQLFAYGRDGETKQEYMPLTLAPASQPAGTRFISATLTEMLHTDSEYFGRAGWVDAWRASFWPARPDLAVAHAVPIFLRRMDATSSSWDAAAPLLHPLLRPERGWPAISMFAMCLAFFSRDADARAVAADALIEGILDGRVQPELLGKTLAEFSWHSWAKLNRLGEALQNVGRVSNWAALVVVTMLETFIAEWQNVPRDAHHVLSLLLDLLTSLKRSPTETTIGKLSGLRGKSKTSVIATRFAALQSVHDPKVTQLALLEAVQTRVERAHRCL